MIGSLEREGFVLKNLRQKTLSYRGGTGNFVDISRFALIKHPRRCYTLFSSLEIGARSGRDSGGLRPAPRDLDVLPSFEVANQRMAPPCDPFGRKGNRALRLPRNSLTQTDNQQEGVFAMRVAKISAALVLGLFVVGVVSNFAVTPAHAQIPPRDHYKVYDIFPDKQVQGVVKLNDQFGPSSGDFVGPVHFGLPVHKNNEPIFDARLHYTWYKYFTEERGRLVVYENQFGESVVHTTNGVYMLVPALKFPQPDDPAAVGDHFKCYEAIGEPLGKTVTLETQFGFEDVIVDAPELFCNPAEKQTSDGQVFPIINEKDHLVCYRIEPRRPVSITVSFLDQFGFGVGALAENRWLCVPSLKTGVTQAEDMSWGRLKTIYR
jgi:hypothetical protein